VDDLKMAGYVANTDRPEIALNELKCVISVFNYLGEPIVQENMYSIANNVRAQFQLTQDAWSVATGEHYDLVAAWDEFIRDLLTYMTNRAANFVDTWIEQMAQVWSNASLDPAKALIVFSALRSLRSAATYDIKIDASGLH
jgi:hypothetical protein